MGRKRKDVTAAVLTFVRSSDRRDEMFVVNFNEHVSFGLPDMTLFSASAEDLDRALNGTPANGKNSIIRCDRGRPDAFEEGDAR
jgi:hypothetical protein